MLLAIGTFDEINGESLMAIYREGNVENVDHFYPDAPDKAEALQKYERDFLNYIKTDFLANGQNRYMVLERNGVWVSALRLYRVKDSLYYIEALETHPEHRKMGYGSALLTEVLEALCKRGPFEIYDCVSKTNLASIRTHIRCGFEIANQTGHSYIDGSDNERAYGMRYKYGI